MIGNPNGAPIAERAVQVAHDYTWPLWIIVVLLAVLLLRVWRDHLYEKARVEVFSAMEVGHGKQRERLISEVTQTRRLLEERLPPGEPPEASPSRRRPPRPSGGRGGVA